MICWLLSNFEIVRAESRCQGNLLSLSDAVRQLLPSFPAIAKRGGFVRVKSGETDVYAASVYGQCYSACLLI